MEIMEVPEVGQSPLFEFDNIPCCLLHSTLRCSPWDHTGSSDGKQGRALGFEALLIHVASWHTPGRLPYRANAKCMRSPQSTAVIIPGMFIAIAVPLVATPKPEA